MTAHRVYGAALFFLAALLFASSFSSDYAVEALFGDVSTVFVPRLFLIAWMAFAALVFARGFTGPDIEGLPEVAWRRLGLVASVGVLTGLGMLTIGFLLSTVPGFFAFVWLYGYRRPVPLLLISLFLPLAIWLIFVQVFQLPLPQSPWFESF